MGEKGGGEGRRKEIRKEGEKTRRGRGGGEDHLQVFKVLNIIAEVTESSFHMAGLGAEL